MSALKRAWRFLGGMGVASVVLFLLLLVSLLGSFLPQLPSSVIADPDQLSAWLAGARERYGSAADLLSRWGAFALFRSLLYVAPLVLIALSALACTLDRWRAAWRRAFHRPVRRTDPHFAGARAVTLPPLSPADVQDALEQRGYRVRSESEKEVTHLRADRYGLSGLARPLTHLAVLLLLVGYGLTIWLSWQVEVEVGPGETANVGHGTGLLVRNDGFHIDHYADGSTADYQGKVALLDAERLVGQGTVRVNGPLRYHGLGVYLMGFRDGEAGATLILRVAHDPGAWVALAGGLLLLVGMTATVYLPHRRLYARLEPERTLLAVRSSGRDDEPQAELTALARELGGC